MLKCITALVSIALFAVACSSCVHRSGKKADSPSAHSSLYLVNVNVDAAFTAPQRAALHTAFLAWRNASSGMVVIVPHWGKQKPYPFREHIIPREGDGVFFWSLDKFDVFNMTIDLAEEFEHTLGVMIPADTAGDKHVVVFEDVDPAMFYRVALHELGHALGLPHMRRRAVMHPHVASACITEYDAAKLCAIHHCIPKPEC